MKKRLELNRFKAQTTMPDPNMGEYSINWTEADERTRGDEESGDGEVAYDTLGQLVLSTQEEKDLLKQRIPKQQVLEMLAFRKRHGLSSDNPTLKTDLNCQGIESHSVDRRLARSEENEFRDKLEELIEENDILGASDHVRHFRARAGLIVDGHIRAPYWGWDDRQSGDARNPSVVQVWDQAARNGGRMPRQRGQFGQQPGGNNNAEWQPSLRMRMEVEKDFEQDPKKWTPRALSEKYRVSRDVIRAIIKLKHVRDNQPKERADFIQHWVQHFEAKPEDLIFHRKGDPLPNLSLTDAFYASMGCDPRMSKQATDVGHMPDSINPFKQKRSSLPTFLTDDELEQLLEKERPEVKTRLDRLDQTFWPEVETKNTKSPEDRTVAHQTPLRPRRSKMVFIDATKDLERRARSVRVRDTDGTLREAEHHVKRRITRKFYPVPRQDVNQWPDIAHVVQQEGVPKHGSYFESPAYKEVLKKEAKVEAEDPSHIFFNELREKAKAGEDKTE